GSRRRVAEQGDQVLRQDRLLVPGRWLHLTTQGVEFTDTVTDADIAAIIAAARDRLAAVEPPMVMVGRPACCSAVSSGFFFVTVSSVSVITAPFLLNTRLSGQCRKHLL